MMTLVQPRGSWGGGDAGAPGRSEWMGRAVSEAGPGQREQAELRLGRASRGCMGILGGLGRGRHKFLFTLITIIHHNRVANVK